MQTKILKSFPGYLSSKESNRPQYVSNLKTTNSFLGSCHLPFFSLKHYFWKCVQYKISRLSFSQFGFKLDYKRYQVAAYFFDKSKLIPFAEEERDPYKIPIKHNIMMAMYWLVKGCQPGDSLVFHYSGHGSQQRDYRGEEADGYDETLCPLDFQKNGMIVDNDINEALVRPLPSGVRLHAIIDACHSGTMLDLPYLCRMNRSVI